MLALIHWLDPVPFLSSALLGGMTFPFLSDRNPLWTPSNPTLKHFFFKNNRPTTLSLSHCCFFFDIEASPCDLFELGL